MDRYRIEPVSAVISYVEAHLDEKLDLDTVAKAAGYSKYHLHRMFAATVGLTLHDYIQRRQLTEAARLLVCSEKPVAEIAPVAGYESQQAFSTVFKAMYKQTPVEYRQNRAFYPLQLEFTLNMAPSPPGAAGWDISYATPGDLPGWMNFAALVIDGFPCLEETSHLEQVKRAVRRSQVLVMRDGGAIIGAAACSVQAGHIDFFAVHPQYRSCGAARALLDFMRNHLFEGREISITTFRAGDRADTGQRAAYMNLGFAESEFLTEFGYPTQRLVLPPEQGRYGHGQL